MLFRSKKCSQCDSQYDVVSETCPVCHAKNEEFEALKIPKNHVWIPFEREILLFIFGIILLNLVSLIMQLFLTDDSVQTLMIINGTRYAVVAVTMGCALIGRYKNFKNSFVKPIPYLIGLGGGVALILFSILYSNFIASVYPTEPNANQTAANALVTTYPVLSILLLGIVGPAVEELTYRVGLFSLLTRVHRAVAYVVTILIFALIHFNFFAKGDAMINELLNLPSYVIAGALLCFLYDRFGLGASLTAHVINNLVSVILAIVASSMK